jgi:hypothetical protein
LFYGKIHFGDLGDHRLDSLGLILKEIQSVCGPLVLSLAPVEAAVDVFFKAALDPKNILNPGKGIGT